MKNRYSRFKSRRGNVDLTLQEKRRYIHTLGLSPLMSWQNRYRWRSQKHARLTFCTSLKTGCAGVLIVAKLTSPLVSGQAGYN